MIFSKISQQILPILLALWRKYTIDLKVFGI